MALQAEAERERRAKVIAAQGELQASETLAQAAHTLAREPASLQLRYLQTVTEIAAENNSTTIFPLPIELFKPFMDMAARAGGKAEALASGLPVVTPAAPAALPPGESPDAPMSAQALTDVMGRLRAEAAEQFRKDHG
jgi:regulator of protease activity HflC (stomatin/prohibitin superfamily)